MGYFAVIREPGPAWDPSRAMAAQGEWAEHAAFMNGLAEDGFVVLGGPLDGGPKILLIVGAEDEQEIERRLADDPWTPMELLQVTSITPWQILLGN